MASISDIIKSRFKGKEDWYYERLDTCLNCEYWSANKNELKGKDIGWKIANLGKDFCTICKCPENKLRLETESCPKGKWLAVDTSGQSSKIPLINLSENVAEIDFDPKQGSYSLDYGDIKVGDNTEVNLLLDSKDRKVNNLRVDTSCRCTKSEPEKQEEGYRIKVSYKTSVGGIRQSVKISYKNELNQLRLIVVHLKGRVTN